MGEMDGYQIWMINERKMALRLVLFFKPEGVCSSRNAITQTESTSLRIHVAPTEETEVLQIYKTAILPLLLEEVVVRIKKFTFKTAKAYNKRYSQIKRIVVNKFA